MCGALISQVIDVGPREPLSTTFSGLATEHATHRDISSRCAGDRMDRRRTRACRSQRSPRASLGDVDGAILRSLGRDAHVACCPPDTAANYEAAANERRSCHSIGVPPYLGSQKSLVPDLVIVRDDTTIIIDAKYKEHWEDMQQRRWADLEEELRERHRADLLQVLAYSTVARTSRVLVCLAYPCTEERWLSLRARNLLVHRASLPLTDRRVELILVAFPLSTRAVEEAVSLNGGRDPSPGSIVTKLSFAACDTSLCGGGTVGADRFFHSLDMSDPFGVVASFIFRAILALPQRH